MSETAAIDISQSLKT